MGQRLSRCPGARCLLASVGVDMRVGTKRASTLSLFPGNKLCLCRKAASVHVTPVSIHPCLSILPKHPELLLGASVPQQREEGVNQSWSLPSRDSSWQGRPSGEPGVGDPAREAGRRFRLEMFLTSARPCLMLIPLPKPHSPLYLGSSYLSFRCPWNSSLRPSCSCF